jgi:hypothetical protein
VDEEETPWVGRSGLDFRILCALFWDCEKEMVPFFLAGLLAGNLSLESVLQLDRVFVR